MLLRRCTRHLQYPLHALDYVSPDGLASACAASLYSLMALRTSRRQRARRSQTGQSSRQKEQSVSALCGAPDSLAGARHVTTQAVRSHGRSSILHGTEHRCTVLRLPYRRGGISANTKRGRRVRSSIARTLTIPAPRHNAAASSTAPSKSSQANNPPGLSTAGAASRSLRNIARPSGPP